MGIAQDKRLRADRPETSDASADSGPLLDVFRELQEIVAREKGVPEAELEASLALGARALGVDFGGLFRVERGELHEIAAVSASPGAPVAPETVAAARGHAAQVVATSERVCVAREDARVAGDGQEFDFFLGVPLLGGGEIVEVLWFAGLSARATPFSPQDDQVVEIVARQMAAIRAHRAEIYRVGRALNRISATAGESFFGELAQVTADLLDLPYVLVCEYFSRGSVRTLSVRGPQGNLDNFEYDLAGTPCLQVREAGFCACPDLGAKMFEGAVALRRLGARSYLGAVIRNEKGEGVGQILALDTQPGAAPVRKERLIHLLAARATAGFGRVRAEQRLGEQDRRIELVAEAGHVGFWEHDLEAGRMTLDVHARRLLGVVRGDGDDLSAWREAVHPADLEEIRATVDAHLRDGTPAYTVEYRMQQADGNYGTFLARGRAVPDGRGKPTRIVGALVDISDRKELEAERSRLEKTVHRAQRLESLGVLAGGLAHEFNDLLMSVLGNAGLARREARRGSALDEKLAEIETAAQRAAQLTHQMLAFSGRVRVASESVDLNELVDDLASVLRSRLDERSALSVQLDCRSLPVESGADEIREMVLELVSNASDALEGRPGALTITSGLRTFDRDFLREVVPDTNFSEGRYVFLEIEDDGAGMDEETRGRVFEPFFTTKTYGRGLGLARVLGIQRSNGGGIHLRSVPGEGTRMTLLFVPAEADEAMLEDPTEDEDSWQGPGAVLVVDDEDMVRSLLATFLADAGFDVLTASDGVEALAIFEENRDRIRVILLDMMMPRMNGQEVYAHIRAESPDTSIILMSGYSEDRAKGGIAAEEARFLKKPFELDDLVGVVKDVLDS